MTEAPGRYGNYGNSHRPMTFSLRGAIVPKARPRVTSNGTFMPHRYRDWKEQAIAALTLQAAHLGLTQPIDHTGVEITLMGKHPRRGDLDNLAGSILDALVQAGILRDDSVAVVNSLAIALYWSGEPPTVQIQLQMQQRTAA